MRERNAGEMSGDKLVQKHICLCYGSKNDLFDIAVPFLKKGLEGHSLCVWVIPKSIGIDVAQKALARVIKNIEKYIGNSQMWLFESGDWYLKAGQFNPDQVLDNWGNIIQSALRMGFSGVCAVGEPPLLHGVPFEDLAYYEKRADEAIQKSRMKALCVYPLEWLDMGQMFTLSGCHGVFLENKAGRLQILTQ